MKPKVLFGVLNWGLGHAGRSIPVINELLKQNFEVIIASDGEALKLLKLEFPHLNFHELPSYKIRYPFESIFLNITVILYNILKAIFLENRETAGLVEQIKPDFIISDNRFGFRNKSVMSIFITHQTNLHHKYSVISFLANLVNKFLIKSFDRLWIPDFPGLESVAGKLSRHKYKIPFNYLGILSRLKKQDLSQIYDVGIILSGPEPQRSFLEKKLIDQISGTKKNVILIQGLVDENNDIYLTPNVRIKTHAYSAELNDILNKSKIIVSRSGYSTIMDIVKIGKKAIFIPTPGQTEQEYLAEYLKNKKLFNCYDQKDFDFETAISESDIYQGLYYDNQELLNKAIKELKIEN